MMVLKKDRTDLPVLLLHNIDSAWNTADRDSALQESAKIVSVLQTEGHPVTNVAVCDADLGAYLRCYDPSQYIVFNWCEDIPGVPNSEMVVARLLEELQFTYTGSPPDVLHACWDKQLVKQILENAGVPTPRWRVYHSSDIDGWQQFPAIVKPSREHCSYGITAGAVVASPDELSERIAYILEKFRQPVLVEDFIDGREFHISLWGNRDIEMLPPAEMDFAAFDNVKDRLCTYDSKFTPDSTHYEKIELKLPAPLDENEYEQLRRICLQAYQTIGCRDYARLDVRLRDGIFYLLDINPNSDISADASTALTAEIAGYSYGQMLSHIVNLAAQRHPLFRNE
jgi:D-alanine-D-alanine ligase